MKADNPFDLLLPAAMAKVCLLYTS
ncbi:hypothetical protein, partial [Escherichia coli]